jgi:hypothetical protein
MRERGLADDSRRAGIADIDGGEILRRPFMRDPENSASIFRDLKAHSLPDATETAQRVVGQEPHIVRDGTLHGAALWRSSRLQIKAGAQPINAAFLRLCEKRQITA